MRKGQARYQQQAAPSAIVAIPGKTADLLKMLDAAEQKA